MSESVDPPTPNACPVCGAALSEAAGGLCPRCLMADAAQPTNVPGTGPGFEAPGLAAVTAAFPQFEIIELIGVGGMGTVWRARQPKLHRHVALKLLPASLAERDPAFAERFEREGQLLARLHHPNIVTVHDSGRAESFFYLVMEFVDGVNLRQAMRASRFTPQQALAIVPKICDALHYAHEEGVLHRDIKPENILLDAKGRVKLVDFGIAKLVAQPDTALTKDAASQEPAASGGSLTLGDATLGTPNYMAPEQIDKPADVDHRADIYSLGVVFYELLTGELPLGKFAPPSEKSAADPRLDGIVQQALEKERGRRQQSVGEMRTQVESIAGSPIPADLPEAGRLGARTEVSAWSRWLPYLGLFTVLAGLWWSYIWRHDPVEGRSMRPTGIMVAVVGMFVLLHGLLQSLKSRASSAPAQPLSEPRFSRTAIVGAAWSAFSIFAALFLIHLQKPFLGVPPASIAGWVKLAVLLLLIPGFTAPVGATILGWISVFKIRCSQGRLYGLGLAVFDGLLFPLLALDALIIWAALSGRTQPVDPGLTSGTKMAVQNIPALVVMLMMAIIIVVDLLIIRAVWRAVNPATETPAASSSVDLTSEAPPALRPTIILHAVLLSLVCFALLIGIPQYMGVLMEMRRSGVHVQFSPLTQFVVEVGRLWGLLIFPVILGVDVAACYLARALGGQHGLRWWSGTVIVGLVLMVTLAGAALWLPMRKFVVEISPVASSHSAFFGPVIERVLPFDRSAIDFQTGGVMQPEWEKILALPDNGYGRWIQDTGTDALVEQSPGPTIVLPASDVNGFPRLVAPMRSQSGEKERCVFVSEEKDDFDSVQPTDADARLKVARERNLSWNLASGPRPWWFQTLDGAKGVLQILGTSDAPRGLKIRYKLVQTAKKWLGGGPGVEIVGPAIGFSQAQMRAWVEKRLSSESPQDTYQPLEWGEPESVMPQDWVTIRYKFVVSFGSKPEHYLGHRYYTFTKTGEFVRSDYVDGPEVKVPGPVKAAANAGPPALRTNVAMMLGPENNGLEAGLTLRTADHGNYLLGKPIEVQFHIRNASKANIFIGGSSWRQEQASALTITDENGRMLKTEHNWYSGGIPYQRNLLQPGESAVFHSSALAFISDEMDAAKVQHPVGNFARAKPGRYTVTYRLRFPDADETPPQPADWKGELVTAPVTIEVKAASPETQPGASATPRAGLAEFGPVMERVLASGEPCREQLFHFRSGRVFIVGNGPGTSPEEAAYDEQRIDEEGGVDMSAVSGKDDIRIVGRGCIFTRDVHELVWEGFSAAQALRSMSRASFVDGMVTLTTKEFPVTYLFKTARGEVGIMEVIGVVDDKQDGWTGKGMKFRYKLVEGTGTTTTAAPVKSSLVFGPETRGLQAAVEVTPGEPFKLRLHVRNVSERGIAIDGAGYRQDDECLLGDAQGRPVPITKVPHDIKIGMKGGYFGPGQVAIFESAGLSFQDIDKAPSSAGYVATAKPGRYTLRVRLRLPGTDVPFPAGEHSWKGELETGPVTIEVKEPSTQPITPVADSTFSAILGPIVERVVNDLQTIRENCALSLDSGKLLPVPEDITLDSLSNLQAQPATLTWARDNQVDAVAFVTMAAGKIVKCGLLCPGLLVLRANNKEWVWDSATPRELKEEFDQAMHEWKKNLPVAEITSDGDFPASYMILDTRTHRRGVLQITGVADNPRGVKIRYRLVEGAPVKKVATTPSPAAPTPSSSSDESGKSLNHADVTNLKSEWEVVSVKGDGIFRHQVVKVGDRLPIAEVSLEAGSPQEVLGAVGSGVHSLRDSYTVTPLNDPKEFDVRFWMKNLFTTQRGIYRLEGDTLTLCVARHEGTDKTLAPHVAARQGGGAKTQQAVAALLPNIERLAISLERHPQEEANGHSLLLCREKRESPEFVLRPNVTSKQVEQLLQCLAAIGYFERASGGARPPRSSQTPRQAKNQPGYLLSVFCPESPQDGMHYTFQEDLSERPGAAIEAVRALRSVLTAGAADAADTILREMGAEGVRPAKFAVEDEKSTLIVLKRIAPAKPAVPAEQIRETAPPTTPK